MFVETNHHFQADASTSSANLVPDAERMAGSAIERRLAAARRAFTTRNVSFADVRSLDRSSAPTAGDLVLARVVAIGQHPRLESPAGRREALYPGDEIVVVYGNRYAPDQFDAVVPETLDPCDLVAGGGIAAIMKAKHHKMKNPTRIEPIGLLAGEGDMILNVSSYSKIAATQINPLCKVIVIVGTSMNAGKTTTAATLIHGLNRAGLKVGAAKVTGTGSGGDIWSMVDAGARVALDFTDAGHGTTAGVPIPQLIEDSLNLIAAVSQGNDVAVIEVADGLFQTETSALLQEPRFAGAIDKVILAAGDAMGAAFGYQWLAAKGLPISLIAGCVGSSPLGLREAACATGLPVATLSELGDPQIAPRFCFGETLLASAA
ncbi:DUF1611 domain-containing protein [Sphingobium sp. HBC34]|uniref:DUF1611 domain-containing protein n=1 Tax=Sphingobium cyanobacteriorum TaxID=3063954 RepID=A0ABT8ZT40_9SPHN|nr:DUF1611 domain-containing protein [Sphingobium sp. HBC34]MDO7837159.1 DUF1611 domain-containing protein [Sphingobium sp. HBC34]